VRSIISVCTVVALAAMTVICPGTASAAARAHKILRLRQGTPITAIGGDPCPEAVGDRDGWHFVVLDHPRRVAFSAISVTFDPGGTQTITSFAGQTDAYVFSDRGASLLGATAEVEGGLLSLLRLVHFDLVATCVGRAPQPVVPAAVPAPQEVSSPSARPTPVEPSEPATATATASPSASASARSPRSASVSASATPSASEPDIPSEVDDQPQIQVPEVSSTMVADVQEAPSGLGFPGFVLIATALFLVLFGGLSTFLLVRRRKIHA
jgi:hypothetical protein